MKWIKVISLLFSIVLITKSLHKQDLDSNFVSYVVNPKKDKIDFYWKNQYGERYGSLQKLKTEIEKTDRKLLFAMNGGMYDTEGKPIGLYIDNGNEIVPVNKKNGHGNFHLKPNGIFAITKSGKAIISATENFVSSNNIKYATQSGPMLLIDGKLHPAFNKGSANVHTRNGVGILPDGKILFAMSKTKINFYDFAQYFKSKGCNNALYLDGFVSRTYLPEKNWVQTDGNFGVIIGVTK